jgi:transcription elongation regulator 1
MLAGPPPGMPPFGGPPGQFGAPPFGLPPPGFQGTWPAPGQASWPAGPPGAAPWGMPPGLLTGLPGAMPAIDEAAVLAKVDPEIIGKAAEWSEHKSPDGRFYYYNAKKGESVWEKPQPLKDLESALVVTVLKFIVNRYFHSCKIGGRSGGVDETWKRRCDRKHRNR